MPYLRTNLELGYFVDMDKKLEEHKCYFELKIEFNWTEKSSKPRGQWTMRGRIQGMFPASFGPFEVSYMEAT